MEKWIALLAAISILGALGLGAMISLMGADKERNGRRWTDEP